MTEATAPPKRTRGRLLLVLGLVMLASMVLVTLFGPLIAPHGAATTSPDSLAGPSAAHWLGTDSIGRDDRAIRLAGQQPRRLGREPAAFILDFHCEGVIMHSDRKAQRAALRGRRRCVEQKVEQDLAHG